MLQQIGLRCCCCRLQRPISSATMLAIPARYRRTTPAEGKSLYVLVAMSTSPQANHLAVMPIPAAVVMHWALWRTGYLHRLPCVYAGLAGPAFRYSTSSNSGLVNMYSPRRYMREPRDSRRLSQRRCPRGPWDSQGRGNGAVELRIWEINSE